MIKSTENTIFYKIPQYESFRYIRRGAWNLVSVGIVVLFFTIALSLRTYWPKEIENEWLFYFVNIQVVHHMIFISCNVVMMLIYKSRLFEGYKTFEEPWPWDSNNDEWRVLLTRTFKYIFFNQIVLIPLSLVVSSYNNWICPSSVSFDELPDLITLILHLGIFILCEDFSFYWVHRLLHHKSLYPYIHKIHHQYRLVVGIATEYCHPIEYVFANLLCTSSGVLLLGKRTHLFTHFVWTVIRVCETTDGHSGYEFPWSPFRLLSLSAGQEYHNYHHLNFDGNYGSFLTIWDRLFNTTNKAFLNFIDKKYNKECDASDGKENTESLSSKNK